MQSLFSISSSVLLTLMGQDPSSAIKAPWFAYIFSLFRFLASFSTFSSLALKIDSFFNARSSSRFCTPTFLIAL